MSIYQALFNKNTKDISKDSSKTTRLDISKDISKDVKREIHDYSKLITVNYLKKENNEIVSTIEKYITKVVEGIKNNIIKNGIPKGRDLECEVTVSLHYTFDLFTKLKDILSEGELEKRKKENAHWFHYENLKNSIDLDEDKLINLFCKWVL